MRFIDRLDPRNADDRNADDRNADDRRADEVDVTADGRGDRLADLARRADHARPDPVESIRERVDARELAQLSAELRVVPEGDVVRAIRSLPADDALVVFRLLDKDASIEVFDDLPAGTQADLLEAFTHAQVADVVGALDPEDQARLLDEVPAKVAKRVLAAVGPAELDEARALLGYPAGSVGRRVSPARVTAAAGETVGDVLDRVRAFDGDLDEIAVGPVLATHRRLLGTVEPTRLLRAPGDARPLGHGRRRGSRPHGRRRRGRRAPRARPRRAAAPRRRPGGAPRRRAADRRRRAHRPGGRRRGPGARGRLRAAAAQLPTSVGRIARSRIVWLLVLAVSAVLTVNVLEIFEATLAERVALALFIPLVTGIGGNTGSQAATTVTRALAVGDVRLRDVGRVAFTEVRTGLLLGTVLGALAFAAASTFYGTDIGLVIGLTLLVNCPVAATVGGVVPLVARACRVDPAVFSTPFISTFCDASGLVVYFTVAISVLGLAV